MVDQKKLSSLREFLVILWEVLGDQISFWCTKTFFGRPNFFLVYQKFPETDQKFPETGQFFFWSTKKNEKKTEQLVDQETDQNHMDGTKVKSCFWPRSKNLTLSKIYWTCSKKFELADGIGLNLLWVVGFWILESKPNFWVFGTISTFTWSRQTYWWKKYIPLELSPIM